MAPKKDDRLRAIREQAAGLKRRQPEGAPAAEGPPPDDAALTAHFGIPALEQATAGRAVQRLAVGHIAPALDPEARQPRLLPLPDELLVDGEPAPEHAALVAELRDLGRSLGERQIQPVIVYPGRSGRYPAATHLLLVGHRRWLAACLSGISALDAIVIDPPSPAERVLLQYAENEDRADFTDMERAWALEQMKRALDDAPWEAVEQRFRLSSTRRHELARLLAFTPEQQRRIARLRLRENQVEPLHRAVRAQELAPPQVDAILDRVQRTVESAAPGARPAVDGMTVARLVAQARRSAGGVSPQPPQWAAPFEARVAAAHKEIRRLQRRFSELDEAAQARLAASLRALRDAADAALASLGGAGNSEGDG